MAATGRTAEIVIVGAGIMGLSIAFQLARRGGGRVVLLEKSTVAVGSTGASSACLRLRYSYAEVVRLAASGLDLYARWPEFTGLTHPRAAFAHTGVLWMLNEDAATVESERVRMAASGASVVALDAGEVRKRFPALSLCGKPFSVDDEDHECEPWPAYLYETDGGYCSDPTGAAQDLQEVAEREGVDVRTRTGVVAIRSEGGRIRGVDLSDGSTIDAPVVINAAGPWCNRVNAMAGVQLNWPLRPTRAQIMLKVAAPDISAGLPMVGDASGGIYFRPENHGRQILVGSIRAEDERELVPDPDSYNERIDADMKKKLLYELHHRIPSLPYEGRITGTAGLYTVNTEDVHPLIGPTPLEGFMVVNGFSGHGFKLGPAVGGMVARHLTGTALDDDPDVPIEFFSITRSSLAPRERNVLA